MSQNAFCSQLIIYGLSSVLKKEIRTIYPFQCNKVMQKVFPFNIFNIENKKYIIDFPTLNTKIKVAMYNQVPQKTYNLSYNTSLQKYFENTLWCTLLFWFDVIHIIKNHMQHTTATVEVQNNIIKNMNIKKKTYILISISILIN